MLDQQTQPGESPLCLPGVGGGWCCREMSRSRLGGRCSPESVHPQKSPSDGRCLSGPQREGLCQGAGIREQPPVPSGQLVPLVVM